MRHHIPSADDIAGINDQETAWLVSKRFRHGKPSIGGYAADIEDCFNGSEVSDSTRSPMTIVFQLEEPMKRDCSLILPPPSKYQRPTRN
jgi:hypothetical protein